MSVSILYLEAQGRRRSSVRDSILANDSFATIVMTASGRSEPFGSVTGCEGGDVEISGVAKIYKGQPEIILHRPDQLILNR